MGNSSSNVGVEQLTALKTEHNGKKHDMTMLSFAFLSIIEVFKLSLLSLVCFWCVVVNSYTLSFFPIHIRMTQFVLSHLLTNLGLGKKTRQVQLIFISENSSEMTEEVLITFEDNFSMSLLKLCLLIVCYLQNKNHLRDKKNGRFCFFLKNLFLPARKPVSMCVFLCEK